MFIFILVLTSCTPVPEATPETPKKPVIQPEKESVVDGQTLTVVVPEAPKDSHESKYQIQTRLTDFHMLSESTGIAWGLTNTSLRLYLTEDYGETWVNISPSPNVKFVQKVVYGRDMVFTDRENGWIVRAGQGNTETMLLNTTDGGKDWKFSSLPKSGKVEAISFTSPMYGWIMTSGKSSGSSQEKTLYRTTDNGKTWGAMMQNSDYRETRTSGTVIPRTGSLTGMVFGNAQTGFVTVKETQGSKLYLTKDGGEKWGSLNQVFRAERMDDCDSYSAGIPVYFGGSESWWIPVTCIQNEMLHYMGYFTKNNGNSWNLVSFPLKPKTKTGNLPPVFRRYDQGWSVVDGIVHTTENMGKTWTAFEQDPELTKNLERYPFITKMQFASPQVGWMLVETADGSRSRLLLSMDGGETWRVR